MYICDDCKKDLGKERPTTKDNLHGCPIPNNKYLCWECFDKRIDAEEKDLHDSQTSSMDFWDNKEDEKWNELSKDTGGIGLCTECSEWINDNDNPKECHCKKRPNYITRNALIRIFCNFFNKKE